MGREDCKQRNSLLAIREEYRAVWTRALKCADHKPVESRDRPFLRVEHGNNQDHLRNQPEVLQPGISEATAVRHQRLQGFRELRVHSKNHH